MAVELPGELLAKSGNRGASLDADLRLRERRAASARSSLCHPAHQSKAGPANDSLFNLSCGLKSSRETEEGRIREGECGTGAVACVEKLWRVPKFISKSDFTKCWRIPITINIEIIIFVFFFFLFLICRGFPA